MATFAYNIAQPELPLTPRVAPVVVPTPQVPFVNPGGNITLGEFVGGGARPNMYGVYDPAGAANVRAALPAQAAYTPGQYGGGSMGMRPALPPASDLPLAVRPNAAPAAIPFEAPAGSAMKPAQVLNVRTIPGTGGASAAPMLEAGGAGRAAGVGSRLAGMGSMVGKALPFVGDVLQGAAYGYEGGSVGRGVAAGLGSLGGRVAGAAGGSLVAPGVGTAVGSVGGSVAGAAGAAKLYDMATGADSPYMNPEAMRQTEVNAANRAVPSRIDMPQGLTANTGGAGDAMRIDAPAPGSTTPQITRQANPQAPAAPLKYDVKSASVSSPAKPQGFQAPSAEEAARFRRETGTPFDPKSINDKLNMDRMRAGEGTFNSRQANAYRAANPNYRPGQYSSGGSVAGSPQAPAAPAVRTQVAPTSQAPASTPMTLEQRGLARTVSVSDPVMGVTRNTSPRPTPAQMGAATRSDYYQRIRESRATNPNSRVRYAGQ